LILTYFTACTITKDSLYVVEDEIGDGKPKGYVAFYSPYGGKVRSLQDGKEIGEFHEIYALVPKIARAPGNHEFMYYHNTFKTHISVPVFPDAITYVSVDGQKIGPSTSSLKYYYIVHVSVGSTPMPILPGPSDARILTLALSDRDWGTRRFALMGFTEAKIVPDSAALEQILYLASSDRYHEVREAASRLLESLHEKKPGRPFFHDTFEDNTYPYWYIGSKEEEADYYFDAEGYNINSMAETCVWETIDLHDRLGSTQGVKRAKTLLKRFNEVPNYDIEVNVNWKDGETNYSYGFAVLQDINNYYNPGITKNGFARVGLVRHSVLQDPPIPWQNHVSELILSNDVNNLKLEVRGKDATYLVNGTVKGKFKLYDGFMLNKIGLIVCGKQKVVFKSIRIEAK